MLFWSRSHVKEAAGLDVFAEDPVRPSQPLLHLKNVVASPHHAWRTRETLERSIDAALRNVERLGSGLPLENRVA